MKTESIRAAEGGRKGGRERGKEGREKYLEKYFKLGIIQTLVL